jgi:hypothetical protein
MAREDIVVMAREDIVVMAREDIRYRPLVEVSLIQ